MNSRMLLVSMSLSLTLATAAAARGPRVMRENHGRDARATSSRDRVIAEVARLGGKVELDEMLPGKPIVKIDLHSTQVTDADLGFLDDAKKELKELRYLDLRLTHIGDAGAANLKHLTSLTTLNLFRTQVGDKGFSYLRKLRQLQTLLIGGTKVTDAGLVNLKSMKELKKLSLFQTQVTDAGIPHLKVLSKLESLLISGTKITDAGASELLKALPRLRFGENT
jgi:Leucine-rich repeat (LRR) protein